MLPHRIPISLRLAWRETRGSWRQFVFFLVCFGQEVLASLEKRKIEVTHVRELVGMSAVQEVERNEGGRKNPSLRSTQLVELKVVESNYPLYGQVVVSPAQPFHTLISPATTCPNNPYLGPCFGIVVQESLLITLGIEVGSYIKIGQYTYTRTLKYHTHINPHTKNKHTNTHKSS